MKADKTLGGDIVMEFENREAAEQAIMGKKVAEEAPPSLCSGCSANSCCSNSPLHSALLPSTLDDLSDSREDVTAIVLGPVACSTSSSAPRAACPLSSRPS